MIDGKYIIYAAGFLLISFLFWKEITRRNKSFLIARLVASALSVISLLCLTLPVYYTEKIKTANEKAVILTEGYNKDSVIEFIKNNGDVPIISFDKKDKQFGIYEANYVAGIDVLKQNFKNIKTFHVFGFGFDEDDLSHLPQAVFYFHLTSIRAGITAIHWAQKVRLGETVLIEGKYKNVSSATGKITISDFETTFDSVSVAAHGETHFRLSVLPKNEGRIIYTITVIAGTDTVEKEVAPVQVEARSPLRILMLSSAPSFEEKFLKNYLSEQGDAVVVRSRISKGKYTFDYVNTAAVSLDRITAALLRQTDILIADASELNSLSKPELASILAQAQQQGTGLLVKLDTLATPYFLSTAGLMSASDTAQKLTAFLLDTTGKLPALAADHPLFIHSQNASQNLVWDNKKRLLSIRILLGAGKVVFTTLNNTYTWALSGKEEAYKKFWATLLNNAAKPQPNEEAWRISPLLPVVDEPAVIYLQTDASSTPQMQVNTTSVYLKNNPVLPYEWSGIYYPVKPGWQAALSGQGKPFWWYAYRQTDWQTVHASQKILATEAYAINTKATAENGETKFISNKNNVPQIWFFILFLLSCIFLWLEGKQVFSGKQSKV